MGIHFDGLVDVVKQCVKEGRLLEKPSFVNPNFNLRNYLQSVLFDASLFEFPLDPKNIFVSAKRDALEYAQYINDYIDMSAQYEKYIVTPFDLTAIEDPVSVVFLDAIEGRRYNALVFRKALPSETSSIDGQLVMGTVELSRMDGKVMQMQIQPTFLFTVKSERLQYLSFENDEGLMHDIGTDLCQSVISYVDELVYIMDPANFIIQKENNSSVAERGKSGYPKRRDILRSTIRRPHYLCMNSHDMSDYLEGVSVTPLPLRPVAGHWKTLVSEKFRHMKNQRIFVGQYNRGNPNVRGENGWNYKVMIKEAPNRLTFYDEVRK